MYDSPGFDSLPLHAAGLRLLGGGRRLSARDQDVRDRRAKLTARLEELFSGAPVKSFPVTDKRWSRVMLQAFANDVTNQELLEWAHVAGLPDALTHLRATSKEDIQFLPIFEALHEVHGTAFRPDHLGEYRRQRLERRQKVIGGFVGPYDMPAIGGALPLLHALIASALYPELLDAKQPEVKVPAVYQGYARGPRVRHARYL